MKKLVRPRLWSLLCHAVGHEVRCLSSTPSALLVMVGGVVLYGLLYNLLYRPNVVHDAPVVVVDDSRTPLSRRLIEWIDASPEVGVVTEASNRLEAEKLMATSKAEAIITIPANLEKRIGLGEEGLFVVSASTAEFLYYEAIQRGSLGAMQALDSVLSQQFALTLPPDITQAIASATPANVVGTALFNPTKGYATYLLPSVLIVIIFQTLLMIACIRSGRERELGVESQLFGCARPRLGDAVVIVVGRMLTYVIIYGLFSIFLLGFLPVIFNIPHLAGWLELITFSLLFLPATALFALFFSSLFRDSESGLLILTFFSLGLILLSGISYPLEQMPALWGFVHHTLPAPVGILAFVKLNSLGATLSECSGQLLTLAVQGLLYFIAATLATLHRLGQFSR